MTRYRLLSVLPEDAIIAFMACHAAQEEWPTVDTMMGEGVLPDGATREDYEAALARLVASGRVTRADSILDAIDGWHESASELPLHEWLCITPEEYAALVEGRMPACGPSPAEQLHGAPVFHRCEICGCIWRLFDGSWVPHGQQKPGRCCDDALISAGEVPFDPPHAIRVPLVGPPKRLPPLPPEPLLDRLPSTALPIIMSALLVFIAALAIGLDLWR